MADNKSGRDNSSPTDFNRDINEAKAARNNQHRDTDPGYEKEGFLGMDDLNKMRRRKIQ